LDWQACAKLLKDPAADEATALAMLQREGLVHPVDDDRFSISNLAALLFANKLAAFPGLARKAVRVIKYVDNDRLTAEREIVGQKGYAAGFEGLIKWFEDHLPANEHIGSALRTEVRLYPMVAVRELVANALIHQDLMATGQSPMIEWFKNRLEVTNPGAPLMPPLRMMDHPPESRNDKVATLMRRMNLCEERGSGIDRVIFFVEAYQLPAPDFQAIDDNTKAILYAPRKFSEMSKDDRVRACYQHACLYWLKTEKMTNATLRARFSISDKNSAMVSRIIADTVTQKLIKPWDPEAKSKKHQSYIPFWAR
jgi:predicted HTH transcriptional regulator